MANIDMHLHEEPYELIKNGIKDVEYRLNDDKRRKLQVGDTITFYNRMDENEILKVMITGFKYYPNLLEMYRDTFDRYLNQQYETPEDAVKDTDYYTEEEIEQYGCVAIFFRLL